MATRVIAAQDKTSSGAGDDVQIKAGSANTSGAGGSIIIQPGAQATTGGNGLLIIRQPSGVAGTDEIQLSHDGGKGSIINKDGALQLGGTNIAIRNVANSANTTLSATTLYATGINSSNVINADGVTIDSYSWGIDSSSLNWGQDFNLRVGWSHIKGYANVGLAYTGNNTNGRRATLELTDGSTGGGAWAYRSSTTTVNTSYNDLNLAGHSAFQRLNATAATTITGIAPASTAGGVSVPTWIHTDGRIFWLYNVGTFNITLSNESASSTAGNRVTTQTGANVVLGPGRMMQIVYDGTSSRWRTSGETYPYVFPTADGTNGQVLTTNGSGSLSWATVSAGATASGTTNYIAKFTGTSTLGNSLIFDNGTNVGIGNTAPVSSLHVGSGPASAGITTTKLWVANNTANPTPVSGTGTVLAVFAGGGIYVAGDSTSDQAAFLFRGADPTGSKTRVLFLGDSSSKNSSIANVVDTQGQSGHLTFDTAPSVATGLVERMRITSAGNVGIGTNVPNKSLVIAANSSTPQINIYKSPDGSLNAAQQVVSLGTGSSQSNAGTTGGNEYGILQLLQSGTVRCQFYANVGGAAGSNFVLDGVSFGTTATSAGQVYIIPTSAASKALVVRGAASQSANLQEWQLDTGTAPIYVTSAGTLTIAKTGTRPTYIVLNNTVSTESVEISMQQNGVQRAAFGICGTTNAYILSPPSASDFGFRADNVNILFSMNAGSSVQAMFTSGGLFGVGTATTAAVTGMIQANPTSASTKGIVVKGFASQTANLQEWQDSTGTVVAAVSPNGAFTGSSFTPYGTFNSTTTIFGNNYWTPNYTGGVTSPSAGTYTKSTGNANTWDGQAYSSEGYTKNVYCAARASQTNGNIMFGLNSDPATDGNYTSLDYAWYFLDNVTLMIYENGAQVASYGAYTTSTVLSITYDGSNIQYWKDGVIQRTVARSTGNPLYFDTSFYTLSSSLNSVQFGPIGQPFGISGTSGYHPKFTSQQTLGNSIVYDNGTNVGIGTASPADRLEVSGATNKNVKIGTVAGGLDTSSYNPDISTLGGIVGFQTGISTDYRGSIYAYADSSSNAKLAISSRSDIVFVSYKGNNADSRAMVIKETTGNVGIGTASPSFKLQVDAASVDANIVANVTSGYGGIGVYVAGVNKVVLGYAGANANYGSQTIAGDVVIKTNNSNLHINTGSGNSVTTAYFSSAGNVGIGTTSPSSKLEVNAGTGSVFRATFAATNQIEIGNYSVTSGYRELSIAGSPITLYTGTAGGISVSERVRIDSSGNVGVGTSTSLNGIFTPLHVNAVSSYGSILSSQATSTVVADAGGEIQFAATYRTTFGGGDLTQVARIRGLRENATASNWAGYLAFYTSTGSDTPSASTERMRINSSGNVGVGTASPGARLQVDTGATGTKGLLLKAVASQSANLLEVQNNAGTVLTNIDSGGNLTVATTSSAYTYYSTNTTTRWATGHDSSNGYFRIVDYVWNGTTRLMITPGGNVVLGNAGGDQTNGPKLLVTTGPDTSGGTGAARKGLIVRGSASQTANLQEWQNSSSTALAYMDASGNFFAVSKSFLIDHPTPAKAAEGKKLRYASLEGPENGVYFRGTLTGDNEIILPDYWKDLVDPESITVNLTARKFAQPSLFVVDANAEKVVVESDREICCDFIVYGTRKDIAKLEVEPDGN